MNKKKTVDDRYFPDVSFCIQLNDKQGLEMLDVLEKKRIPFYYIYDGELTGGAVSVNCEHSKPKVIIELSDNGKEWIASADYLKTSKDGVFVKLMTPDNPDDGKPMPEFDEVFNMFKATDENLKKWKDGNL